MNSPAEKLLYENALWRLTTRGILRNGTEATVEGGTLRISRNGAERTIELPKSVPSGFPRYVGDIPVLVAAYNGAAQELTAIDRDGFKRDHVALISYRALACPLKDGSGVLADRLVNAGVLSWDMLDAAHNLIR